GRGRRLGAPPGQPGGDRERRRGHFDPNPIQGVVMFTGLVQDIGSVESVEGGAEGARLRIATRLGAEIGLGDSIAVNGVCLTATEADASGFATEAMNQTLKVTVIGALEAGARGTREMATRADERLGGHIVQGHADGSGRVTEIAEDGFARRV